MILVNLDDELIGNFKPSHTWGQSGMLRGYDASYQYSILPYISDTKEEIRISEAVNMDDIAWFEYFISRAKKAPKRGVASVIAALEKSLNDKKAKIQPVTSAQSSDDLDSKLSLDHRKIVGNTLKEVYNMFYKGRNK